MPLCAASTFALVFATESMNAVLQFSRAATEEAASVGFFCSFASAASASARPAAVSAIHFSDAPGGGKSLAWRHFSTLASASSSDCFAVASG